MDLNVMRNALWSKEDFDDHLYVDIFSTKFHGISIDAVQSEVDGLFNDRPKKDNSKSESFRIEGNQFFDEGKYHLALQKFNRSACYAENDSDQMVMAFSSRANCFSKLDHLQLCVNEMEMIKSSNYPVYLEAKLDSSQEEFQRFLSKNPGHSVRIDTQKVELSFGEHAQYAGVADCLELQQNSEWGRYVTTNRNLEINETVIVENPFLFVDHDCNDLKYNRCSHCHKSMMNFIPCRECVDAMFCNSACLEAAMKGCHKFECQLVKVESDDVECKGEEKKFKMVLNLLCKITSAFDTVHGLIRAIESIVGGTSAASTDAPLKGLDLILQLDMNKEKLNASDWENVIRNSLRNYLVAIRMPEFEEKFVSDEHKRFLKHLIVHLFHTATNATLFADLEVDVDIFRMAELRDYGIGLYPIGSVLNHSCVPNVFCYCVDDRLICKVIRPIKSGEQLFRSYLSGQIIMVDDAEDLTMVEASHCFLAAEYKIDNCKCSYCSLRKSSPQTLPDPWLQTKDPIYDRIYSLLTGKIENFYGLSEEERRLHASVAGTYLDNYEKVYPTREIVVVQMYLQNYWILTTKQRD